VDRVVFGTGTTLARQGHHYNRHGGGTFETCPRCQGHRLTWTPSTDFGIVVHTANGRLVEDSALIRWLLVP